jgi:hypothetical protein
LQVPWGSVRLIKVPDTTVAIAATAVASAEVRTKRFELDFPGVEIFLRSVAIRPLAVSEITSKAKERSRAD